MSTVFVSFWKRDNCLPDFKGALAYMWFIYNDLFIKFQNLPKEYWGRAVVAQWVWFNLKTLCAKGRRFKSPSGHLFQRKFSMKRKNSMIYGPTTTVLHSQPSDYYLARLGKKREYWVCKIKIKYDQITYHR